MISHRLARLRPRLSALVGGPRSNAAARLPAATSCAHHDNPGGFGGWQLRPLPSSYPARQYSPTPRLAANNFLNAYQSLGNPASGRASANGSGESERGRPRGRGELQYTRIGGPIDRSVCDLSETEIRNLINAMLQCRKARDYQKADKIQDELRRDGVHIDDRLKEWRADGKASFERMPPSRGRADGYSPQRSSSRKAHKMPRMKDCQTMDESILAIHNNLDKASNRDISAFWAVVPRLLERGQRTRQPLVSQLTLIFNKTAERIGNYGPQELATTALAFAKVVVSLDDLKKKKRRGGPYHDCLRGILADKQNVIFQFIASTAAPLLARTEPRHLTNLAYAYALVDSVPKLDDGRTLFHHIADKSIPQLGKFNPQDLSNTLNAYAKAGVSHPQLFEKVADHIVGLGHLHNFKPQELSNTLNAFAKAGLSRPALFAKMADHIVGLEHLGDFQPQALSNILNAYAKSEASHPALFAKMADHIVGLDHLADFNPQVLSNTVHAFAKAGVSHPQLFENVGDHIVGRSSLDDFLPQHLSITVNAFAKVKESHPALFEKMADHIVGLEHLNDFGPQALANTTWAFATAKMPQPALFAKVADHIGGLGHLNDFMPQDLSITAWAFAKTGVSHPALFEKVAEHIISLESTDDFIEQDICNVAWAYQKAGVKNGRLADYLLIAAVEKKDELSKRAIKNFLHWTEEGGDAEGS